MHRLHAYHFIEIDGPVGSVGSIEPLPLPPLPSPSSASHSQKVVRPSYSPACQNIVSMPKLFLANELYLHGVKMNNLATLLLLINSSSIDILNGVPTTKRKGTKKGSHDMSKARPFVFTLSRCQEERLISRNGPYIGGHLAFYFKLNLKQVYNAL